MLGSDRQATPRRLYRCHRLGRQLADQRPVLLDAQPFIAALDQIQQRTRRLRNPFNRIAGFLEVMQHGDDAGGHVEPDRVAGAAGGSRIIRHQDRDAAFVAWRPLQADHRGDVGGHLFDAVGFGPIVETAERQRIVGLALALEADCASEDAAVELRQHDMHREIGRCKAALAARPGLAAGRSDKRLEDGNADAVEQRFAAWLGAAGKGGRGDDRCRRQCCGGLFDERDDGRVLQARHEDRHGGHAMPAQRYGQRVDRRDVGGEQHRAVEQDGDDRRRLSLPLEVRVGAQRRGGVAAAGRNALAPRTAVLTPSGASRHLPLKGGDAAEQSHCLAKCGRVVEPDLGQWFGVGRNDVAAGMAGQPAHQRAHIGGAALAEITEQRLQFRFGQRRMRDQPLDRGRGIRRAAARA